MKKILVVISVVLVALVIFGAGFVFAQSQLVSAAGFPQGFGPGGMTLAPDASAGVGGRGGYGQMHEYVEQALADKLGITKAELETQFASGKSMVQIALDHGITQANMTSVLTEVHKTAFAKAVAAGVLTQAQADSMLQAMTANGFSAANCPMGGQVNGSNAGGPRGGRGRMMGGWNQQSAATQVP
jgi:hypothetical protein